MLAKLNPAQTLVAGFSVIILIGSILLSLPIAVSNGEVNFLTSFFTATSALCVTGLVLVDTGTHWTAFGQVVILLLFRSAAWALCLLPLFWLLSWGGKSI